MFLNTKRKEPMVPFEPLKGTKVPFEPPFKLGI